MSEEEKKTPETPVNETQNTEKVVETSPVKEDSDFADATKPLSETPAPALAPAEEVKPAVQLQKIEETPEAKPKEKKPEDKKPAAPIVYAYNDAHLQGIEDARLGFFKDYKHENLIKWIVTGAILVVIIAAWIIPSLFSEIEDYSLYITLGIVALALVALGIYSHFMRKNLDKAMKNYFSRFYELTNAYVFEGTGVSEVTGTVDDKITPEEFNAAGLYKDVYKVGSRASITFKYRDLKCGLADAAGQVKGKRALQAVFVGKFFRAPNNHVGSDVIIYFKGNDRALPPTVLEGLPVLEDDARMVIYGDESVKRLLTLKLRNALSKIHTNETLVDLAISIKSGETFFAMGYEDTLMVLPLEKPFNPAPTEQCKEDIAKVLGIVDALNFKHEETK
jgi:hypothetical protein